MPSRMSAQQLAEARAKASNANELNKLATKAYAGSGATPAEQKKAEAALVAAVGPRKAKQLTEQALQRAGARPKGLGRFFG